MLNSCPFMFFQYKIIWMPELLVALHVRHILILEMNTSHPSFNHSPSIPSTYARHALHASSRPCIFSPCPVSTTNRHIKRSFLPQFLTPLGLQCQTWHVLEDCPIRVDRCADYPFSGSMVARWWGTCLIAFWQGG